MKHNRSLSLLSLAISSVLASPVQSAQKLPATMEEMWAIIQKQQQEIESLKTKAAQGEAQQKEIETLKAKAAEAEKNQAAGGAGSDANRKTDILAKEVENLKTSLVIPESKQYKSQYGMGPAASAVYGVNKGLSIGGYGEAVYTNNTTAQRKPGEERTDKTDQFDAERLVLYVGYKFTDNIILNNEIEFEHATTGEGDEEKGEVSVEFSQLDFLLHPMANVRAGLLLMPMGFINEVHEPLYFHGNFRPEVERRIIPTTWREMGAGLFGELAPGLQYRLYATNALDADGFASNGWRDARQNGSKAKAEDFAVVGRLDYSPDFLPGVLVGGSYYMGNAGQDAEIGGDERNFFTQLYEGHLQWHYKGFEFRTLGAWGNVDDADVLSADKGKTIGKSTFGWYSEAAYDIMPHLMRDSTQYLAPFVRYERFDTIADAPDGFSDDQTQDKEIFQAGLTYKPIRNIAIKADYRNISARDGEPADEFNLGLGFIY